MTTNIELSFPANLITELFKKNDITSILNIADQNIFFETIDLEGCNPLHLACIYGYDSLIEPFLNLGADLNSQNHAGTTILHTACQNGYLDLVNFLITKKVDIDL